MYPCPILRSALSRLALGIAKHSTRKRNKTANTAAACDIATQSGLLASGRLYRMGGAKRRIMLMKIVNIPHLSSFFFSLTYSDADTPVPPEGSSLPVVIRRVSFEFCRYHLQPAAAIDNSLFLSWRACCVYESVLQYEKQAFHPYPVILCASTGDVCACNDTRFYYECVAHDEPTEAATPHRARR